MAPPTAPAPAAGRAPLLGTGFGRLWASAGAANVADGLVFAGLPVLATTLTDSPAAIAGVTVALMLPIVLAALPAGAVTDRADRRRLLVGGNALRAVLLAGAVAIALVDLRLALVYAVAAAATSSEILVDTAAQAVVPALVPASRLEGANARMMVTQVVGNHAAGASIGALLATLGAVALLGPTALLYAAAGLAAWALPRTAGGSCGPERGPERAGAVADEVAEDPVTRRTVTAIAEGIEHLRRDTLLGRFAIASALCNLGTTAFAAVLVVYVVGPLGLPAAAYGALLAALAVGGVLGGAVAERLLPRVAPVAATRAGFVVIAGCFTGFGVTRHLAVVVALVIVLGAVSMLLNVITRSLRQRRVPDALLGRVTASMAALSMVATPVGAMAGGLVAEWVGVTHVAWLAVATNLAALLVLRGQSGAVSSGT